MLTKFEPKEAVLVATDIIYVQKIAQHRVDGVVAYVALCTHCCGKSVCVPGLLGDTVLPPVVPAQWRDKDGSCICHRSMPFISPVRSTWDKKKTFHPAPRRFTEEYPNGDDGRRKTMIDVKLRVRDPNIG